MSIHEIDYGVLEDYGLWLADRGLGPKSRRGHIATFKAFLRWLTRREAIARVPDVPLPKCDEYEPRILSTLVGVVVERASTGRMPHAARHPRGRVGLTERALSDLDGPLEPPIRPIRRGGAARGRNAWASGVDPRGDLGPATPARGDCHVRWLLFRTPSTLWLPALILDEITRLAHKRDIPYQSLVELLLAERVARAPLDPIRDGIAPDRLARAG